MKNKQIQYAIISLLNQQLADIIGSDLPGGGTSEVVLCAHPANHVFAIIIARAIFAGGHESLCFVRSKNEQIVIDL
jgi:hypothetical protein